jgi:hypothetical protein
MTGYSFQDVEKIYKMLLKFYKEVFSNYNESALQAKENTVENFNS